MKTTPNLSQALHLLNGDTISSKILEGKVVDRLLKEKGEPNAVATELYICCLCRTPTPREADRIAYLLAEAPDQQQALEDLFWALVNSHEFIFNH